MILASRTFLEVFDIGRADLAATLLSMQAR